MSIRFISVVLVHLVARILAVVGVALFVEENVGILRKLPYRFEVQADEFNRIVIIAVPFLIVLDICIVVT
jgi:hypothetical protein